MNERVPVNEKNIDSLNAAVAAKPFVAVFLYVPFVHFRNRSASILSIKKETAPPERVHGTRYPHFKKQDSLFNDEDGGVAEKRLRNNIR